jgi:PHD/YefM family antitoxin component YafN of YafNO toxin-antitoxin module
MQKQVPRVVAKTPQYLHDDKGRKAFVVLSIKEYNELLEDLHDLAIIAERREESSISFEEFEAGLKRDGLL